MFCSPRSTRWAIAGIGAAVALLVGGAATVQFRAHATWQSMLSAQQELQAVHDAAPRARTVAWGEPRAGDAFAEYERATTLTRTLLDADSDAIMAVQLFDDERAAGEGAALRERWRQVVEALRRGAHAVNVEWRSCRGELNEGPLHLLYCRWAANAAVIEARALRHRGEHVDAVRHTLDVATFGADLLRSERVINQMIGAAILNIGTAAWPESTLDNLDREALDALALGLQRLDGQLPEAPDHTGEMLEVADVLRHPEQAVDPDAGQAWRYGFSARWMVAEAFLRLVTTTRQLAATPRSWPQRAATFHLVLDSLPHSDPVFGTLNGIHVAELSRRWALAALRLLRMSVDLHRGLDAPPLRDPLGDGPIVLTKTNDRVHLQCVDPKIAREVHY